MATTSGGGGRLSSQNLGDFLRIKEEDHHHLLFNNRATTNSGVDRDSISGLTLSAILSDKVRPPAEEQRQRVQSNRTLLDIIQDDQEALVEDNGQSWRQLTERLRHSCSSASGSGWTSTVPNVTVDNNEGSNRMMVRRLSSISSDSTEPIISVSRRSTERAIGGFEHTSSLHPMRRSQTDADSINHNSHGGEGRGADAAEVEQQQSSGRVSLLTLLAETDAQIGLTGGSIIMLGEEDKAIDSEEVTGGGGGDYNCCVCMVRRKGAAFIPCGHTFCRLCSRQLLVERRNCPLCNAPIHEILDIF
ncbi:hypothetical protein F511_04764 [Dorcoceras hygrometricum]|uniref:RING-type domain-containing protein n=1 Tax=Dorcoceras hygrometricum TaxID=472368 RepID=A0A2Z7AW42_9LAMI|nr:hypothetical protein F511_04764 [Dorcoceras hygrometricum]